MVDLSSITAANNNANFGIRIVATFAPSTTAYAPSNSTSTYAIAGTWRFDMVTINGTLPPEVPEPASLVLGSMGITLLGAFRWRRGSAA
jgi:hypothetical protein